MFNESGECSLAYADLTAPATDIYFWLFISNGSFGTFGNAIAVLILVKSHAKIKSNRILVSLALSDMLVGCVFCPLVAYMLKETSTLRNCAFEYARFSLSVLLFGTSSINVSLIAIDRYILLVRSQGCVTKQNFNWKRIVLILSSWIAPGICLLFKWLNIYAYTLALCMIVFVPLVICSVFYQLIIKETKKKQKHTFSSFQQQNQTSVIRKRQHQRQVNLTKQVSVLILCYIICMFPSAVGLVLNLLYVVSKNQKPMTIQHFFMCTIVLGSLNSVINPLIYASKYPEFKRTLSTSLRRTRKHSTTSVKSNHVT